MPSGHNAWPMNSTGTCWGGVRRCQALLAGASRLPLVAEACWRCDLVVALGLKCHGKIDGPPGQGNMRACNASVVGGPMCQARRAGDAHIPAMRRQSLRAGAAYEPRLQGHATLRPTNLVETFGYTNLVKRWVRLAA